MPLPPQSQALNPADAAVTAADKATFLRDGYHVVRGILSAEEARHYRLCINRAFDLPEDELDNARIDGGTFTLADGVTKIEDFWPIVFDERLLSAVRGLIGEDIRYTQHSDLHINLRGGRFHRDNACREFGEGPDWDEREAAYREARVVVYLSDYRDSHSSLVVLPGSHRRETRLNRLEYVAWNKLRSFARRRGRNDLLPHIFLSAPTVTLKTRPGDCVIFDQRMMHAGGVLRGTKPKYSIFLSFGLNNHHSRNHRAFFLKRPTYSPEIPGALRDRLAKANLLLA